MAEKLPFFPLQLVVYPGESLNLHIFEPRYRQLIADVEKDNITFGVPTVIRGMIKPIATEVALSEISNRYPGGESDIKTIGRRTFRIKNFEAQMTGKLYAGGEVEYLFTDMDEDFLLNEEIVMLVREVYQAMNVNKEVKDAHAGFSTFDIAHYCGFTIDQEYEFLTLFNARDRQLFLLEHLQEIRPRVPEPVEQHIQNRARQNGHFKHLKPPQF